MSNVLVNDVKMREGMLYAQMSIMRQTVAAYCKSTRRRDLLNTIRSYRKNFGDLTPFIMAERSPTLSASSDLSCQGNPFPKRRTGLASV